MQLQGLPFQKVKHVVGTLDAQPSVNDGIFILVTGQLLVSYFPPFSLLFFLTLLGRM